MSVVKYVARVGGEEREVVTDSHEMTWELVVALNHAGFAWVVFRGGRDVSREYHEALMRTECDAGGNPQVIPVTGDIPRPRCRSNTIVGVLNVLVAANITDEQQCVLQAFHSVEMTQDAEIESDDHGRSMVKVTMRDGKQWWILASGTVCSVE